VFLCQTKPPCFHRRFVVIATDAFQPVLQRGDKADIQYARQFRHDNAAAAADENGVAQFRELKQRLGRLLDDHLGRRMQPENVRQRVLNLRGAIPRQEPGEVLREIVVGQNLVHKAAIEYGPGGTLRQ